MSFHPSLDLLRLDLLTSNPEDEVVFVHFDELPSLTFPDDTFHLVGFDVFV